MKTEKKSIQDRYALVKVKFVVDLVRFIQTRLKPVEHGYVFSMAFGTIWEWLKMVP